MNEDFIYFNKLKSRSIAMDENILTHIPQCRISASMSQVSIGSDNGLSPFRHQAII